MLFLPLLDLLPSPIAYVKFRFLHNVIDDEWVKFTMVQILFLFNCTEVCVCKRERFCDLRETVLRAGPEDPRYSWRKLFPSCIRDEFPGLLWKPTPAWKHQVDDLIADLMKLDEKEMSMLYYKLDKDSSPYVYAYVGDRFRQPCYKEIREYWGYMW